jgi:hypothetical protein
VARIKEAVKIVGFNAKNATRAAAILEALEGANKKQKTPLHVELKEIYKDNWQSLKTHNQSLLPVSVNPNQKPGETEGVPEQQVYRKDLKVNSLLVFNGKRN